MKQRKYGDMDGWERMNRRRKKKKIATTLKVKRKMRKERH